MSYKGYTMDDVINNTALQDFQASFTGVAAGVVIQSVTLPFAVETMILFNQMEAQQAASPGSVPMNLRNQLAEYYQMAWGVNNAGSPNVASAFGLITAACTQRYN
jgi:hypothetical protein